MSAELQWMLIRDSSSFLVKRNGVAFSRHPANLVALHNFKYDGLVQPSISVQAVPEGVAITRRSRKVPANKVAKSYSKPTVIKRTAVGAYRAVKIANDMQATGFRLDLVRAAQARICALLDATKPRKTYTKKLRASKLAKLTKKD